MYEKISESTLPTQFFKCFTVFFSKTSSSSAMLFRCYDFSNFGINVVLLLIVIKFINVWSKLCQLTKIYHLTISSPTLQKFVSESARVAGMVKEQRRMSERARLIRKMFRGVLITFHIT